MTNSVLSSSSPRTSGRLASSPRARWFALGVVLAAECMDLIDSTVVNVAAPPIAHELHASSTALQWIVGGYPLAIAIGLITGGRLGDLVGRRRMFVIGVTGFTVASLACGLSPDVATLITARLVQGGFAAMMLPQGFGILREVFPPDEQQKAFSLFGPVIGLSAVLGPIVGGSLVDWDLFGTGWRLVFFINVPLGAAAAVLALRILPASVVDRGARLDLGGTALVSVAAALLVYPLIQGRESGWPWWTYTMMAASVVAMMAFVVQQRSRTRSGSSPLVLTSIFSHRGYSAGVSFAVLFFAGLGGLLLCVTLFLQIGQGFTPIHAALCTVPMSVGLVVGSIVSGTPMAARQGRLTLQLGVALSLVGWLLVLLALRGADQVGFIGLTPGLLVVGVGFGLAVAPMFDIILASVTDPETGSASGVLNAAQQFANAVGVAILGTVFFDAVARGDFHNGLRRVLVVQLLLGVGLLALAPLMPRSARGEDPDTATTG